VVFVSACLSVFRLCVICIFYFYSSLSLLSKASPSSSFLLHLSLFPQRTRRDAVNSSTQTHLREPRPTQTSHPRAAPTSEQRACSLVNPSSAIKRSHFQTCLGRGSHRQGSLAALAVCVLDAHFSHPFFVCASEFSQRSPPWAHALLADAALIPGVCGCSRTPAWPPGARTADAQVGGCFALRRYSWALLAFSLFLTRSPGAHAPPRSRCTTRIDAVPRSAGATQDPPTYGYIRASGLVEAETRPASVCVVVVVVFFVLF
jgi:hypothetical protein